MKKSELRKRIIKDVKKVAKSLGLTKVTKGKYRKTGKYPDDVGGCFASWGELMMAAGMTPTSEEKAIAKFRTKSAETKLINEWVDREIMPYHRKHYRAPKKKGITQVIMGSDMHGKFIDPFALRVFLSTIERRKPDYIVLLGDIYNFAAFSRFPERPSETNIFEELDFVKQEIFTPIKKASPGSKIILVSGNHLWRMWKALARECPQMMDLLDYNGIGIADLLGLDEFEIDFVAKLDFPTGDRRKGNSKQHKNHIKMFDDLFTFVHIPKANLGTHSASGHTHHALMSTSGDAHGVYVHQTLACMCRLDLEYVEGLDTSNGGFGGVHIDIPNRSVYQEPITWTDNLAVIDGEVYRRQEGE